MRSSATDSKQLLRSPEALTKSSSRPATWMPILLAALLGMIAANTFFAQPSWAQQADPAGEAAADTSASPANQGTVPAEEQTLLQWLIQSLGTPYILVFFLLSFAFVAMFVMNLLSARKEIVCPSELVDGFEAHLGDKEYQQAYELAKADESFLGNVLSTGLAKLNNGYDKAIAGMQEVGEEESMKLEHQLSYLALIGTLAPMIGLFGTVHGMINSFSYIAIAGGTPDPNELAKGISTALVTTLIGLAIAIPSIAAFNILRNRVQRLVLEVGIVSEGLMNRFENVSDSGKF